MVRFTDRPDMTLDVYRGRKTTIQQQYNNDMYVKRFTYHIHQDKSCRISNLSSYIKTSILSFASENVSDTYNACFSRIPC